MSTLAQGKADLERASTAQKVADMLRERVLDGELEPGLRLSEEAIGGALGVSRNTLREAFRLLTRDRILIHEHSRGVFVRRPTGDDVRDLYAARRVIECGALRLWNDVSEAQREAVRSPVRQAVARAEKNDFSKTGTANIQFHRGIVGLAGSTRLSDESDRLFAELNLNAEEFALYERITRGLQPAAPPKPDLVIYLQAKPDTLLERIRQRGLEAERRLTEAYVERIAERYTRFFYQYDAAPLLVVDAGVLNPVDRDEDFALLVEHLRNMRGYREFFAYAG